MSTKYWLSSVKVLTILVFIPAGLLVNVGLNRSHTFIGAKYWHIPGAPFVGGFSGFSKVFVTASFACKYFIVGINTTLLPLLIHVLDGGTESLGITAGETENPSKNMPKVVKFVFWR